MLDATPLARPPVAARRASRSRSPLALARPLALVSLLISATVLAQPQGLPQLELERLTLNPSGGGSLVLGTGEVLTRGGYRFSLTGHYQHDPLALFRNGEKVGSLVKGRVTGHLAAAYGVFNWLELSAQVPLLLTQSGDDLTQFGLDKPSTGAGLGTPYVGARLGLLSQEDEKPVDLAVGAQVGLPVGSAASLAKDASPRIIPSVMVGRRFGALRAGLDAGVSVRSTRVLVQDQNIQDETGSEFRLGGVLATTGEGIRGELNLLGSVPFSRQGGTVEALAGGRLPLSTTMEVYGLAGVAFGNAPGTPTFRALLGLAYGHTPPRCVAGGKHTAEECPELDDDNDGVKNADDTCQGQSGRVDAHGCPVKDSDGDGVFDPDDKCPTVPGVAQFQGCPDTDKDGIEDAVDACPAEPGIAELKGCPAKDTDGDTVPDHRDNCPTEPGPVDNQGCPVKEKQIVEIQKDRLEIKDKVYFDTAKATIQKRSFKLLDQV
ncbi:MAG: thrombospondin type 3 repeat-containing protein, partial [Hyalangium sp.]|uniref:thrombospondin type 3 repeat-containing protein n=1 Tax=Hyalangium sp. TaxID=2028555 RepID=UPI00389B03FF